MKELLKYFLSGFFGTMGCLLSLICFFFLFAIYFSYKKNASKKISKIDKELIRDFEIYRQTKIDNNEFNDADELHVLDSIISCLHQNVYDEAIDYCYNVEKEKDFALRDNDSGVKLVVETKYKITKKE